MPAWLLPAAIGVGSALGSLGQSRRDDRAADLSEAELAFLKQRYAEQEPLRAMGLSRLQGPLPERPDQGAAFADPSNPFYKPPQALGFGEGYSNQPPDLSRATKDYRTTMKGGNDKADLGDIAENKDKKGVMLQGALDRGVDPRLLGQMGLGGNPKKLKAMGF